jgi:hypothetical protein
MTSLLAEAGTVDAASVLRSLDQVNRAGRCAGLIVIRVRM